MRLRPSTVTFRSVSQQDVILKPRKVLRCRPRQRATLPVGLLRRAWSAASNNPNQVSDGIDAPASRDCT